MKRADAEILTVNDLAELFACDKETVAARLTSGDLPGVKVGRGWIVPRQALFERLNEKAREEAAARRAQQATAIDEAQRRGMTLQSTQGRVMTILPGAAQSTTVPTQIGRKRRVPRHCHH
ncbi:helix-turn-helix domain-containing protein [Delftia tsuruhatensis]